MLSRSLHQSLCLPLRCRIKGGDIRTSCRLHRGDISQPLEQLLIYLFLSGGCFLVALPFMLLEDTVSFVHMSTDSIPTYDLLVISVLSFTWTMTKRSGLRDIAHTCLPIMPTLAVNAQPYTQPARPSVTWMNSNYNADQASLLLLRTSTLSSIHPSIGYFRCLCIRGHLSFSSSPLA